MNVVPEITNDDSNGYDGNRYLMMQAKLSLKYGT